MKREEQLNQIIANFVNELANLEQHAVSLATITLTIDPAYFPGTGFTEQLMVDGQPKRINEQQGSKPFQYYVTCYEK